MSKKVCSNCRKEKPYTEFYKKSAAPDGYAYLCKLCRKAYSNSWQEKNKEYINLYARNYYKKNKEKLSSYQKSYRQKNLMKIRNIEASSRKRNKEQRKAYNKSYNKTLAKREANKRYRKANREKIRSYGREYSRKHKERNREYMRNYRNSNLNVRLSHCMRSRINSAIRCYLNNGMNATKSGSTIDLLGCSITYLVTYLEDRFSPKMSWSNYGMWHIDHIKPLALFNLVDYEEQLKAFHYTNLQPLWAKENLYKHTKYSSE